jgi:SAM-dependent methyltransferase
MSGGERAKRALNSVHGAAVFGRRVDVLASILASVVPGGGRVLDVGCGDGSIAAALMAERPDLTVDGVDVLVREDTKVPVTAFDGHTLPFDDAAYDVVTLVDVLHHTTDPAHSLAEAGRVAGRAVVVKDHVVDGLLARPTLRLMDWVGNRGHDVVLAYNYLDATQWRDVARRAELVEVRRLERLHLYPAPFTWLFDRHLHVVSVYEHATAPAHL